jgi:anti-sigma regulatory factor (Ser/Thr protein kinase)
LSPVLAGNPPSNDVAARTWRRRERIVMTVRTSSRLPTGTMAVPAARRFTSDVLAAWPVSAQTREIAELVVSELVGNAVQHGDGVAELGLSLGEDALRIEVVDNSPEPPVLLRPEPADDRHRGLLMATLSTGWGISRAATGKTVWADVPTTTTGRPAEPGTTETTPDTSPNGHDAGHGSTHGAGSTAGRPAVRATTAERSPTG